MEGKYYCYHCNFEKDQAPARPVEPLVRAVLDAARALVRHDAADDFWSDYRLAQCGEPDPYAALPPDPSADDEIYPAWCDLEKAINALNGCSY